MRAPTRPTPPRRGGFTLVELLVVIAIIGLISAAALPVVLPALNERRVSEAARILQAGLAGARDAAIRANAPRGIRLLPDPGFNFAAHATQGQPLAANRFVPIEPAPDYNEGVVFGDIVTPMGYAASASGQPPTYLRVVAQEETTVAAGATPIRIVNSPTGWLLNVRQGDRIRFNDSGNYYKVAGPIHGLPVSSNPERYIAYRPQTEESDPEIFADIALNLNGTPKPASSFNNKLPIEYLNLTNGIDDDGDGWIDEACDGIDNDGDGIVDPGFNGIDDDGANGIDDPAEMMFGLDATGAFSKTAGSEYEQEVFVGVQNQETLTNANYIISRRAVVSPNAAETTLPAGVVIDLTTWNASAALKTNGSLPDAGTVLPLPERSRLPVDPFSGFVDIMVDQTGRVVSPGAGSGGTLAGANTPLASLPFYHFWLTDREGVVAPATTQPSYKNVTGANSSEPYRVPVLPGSGSTMLPVPQGTAGYTGPPLQGERRLVTLFAKTGQITSNSITNFSLTNTNLPYAEAQVGVKESQ